MAGSVLKFVQSKTVLVELRELECISSGIWMYQ